MVVVGGGGLGARERGEPAGREEQQRIVGKQAGASR